MVFGNSTDPSNIWGPSLLEAEFVRGRVCQGPSLLGAEMSRNRLAEYRERKKSMTRAPEHADFPPITFYPEIKKVEICGSVFTSGCYRQISTVASDLLNTCGT